jgi:hypothetical protein
MQGTPLYPYPAGALCRRYPDGAGAAAMAGAGRRRQLEIWPSQAGVASPRAARGFPAAETGPPLPPNHPHAAAPTKAPSARYRRAQSPTMAIYEPVPARKPLHLGVSRADSSRQLTAASPCWELPRLPNRWLGIRAGGPRHSVCRLPRGDGRVDRAPSGGGGPYPHLTTRGVAGPSLHRRGLLRGPEPRRALNSCMQGRSGSLDPAVEARSCARSGLRGAVSASGPGGQISHRI